MSVTKEQADAIMDRAHDGMNTLYIALQAQGHGVDDLVALLKDETDGPYVAMMPRADLDPNEYAAILVRQTAEGNRGLLPVIIFNADGDYGILWSSVAPLAPGGSA